MAVLQYLVLDNINRLQVTVNPVKSSSQGDHIIQTTFKYHKKIVTTNDHRHTVELTLHFCVVPDEQNA